MRICLFSSYTEERITDNVFLYIKELSKHCEKVVFITNHRDINSIDLIRLMNIWVQLEFVANWWYDFGMFNSFLLTNKEIINKYDQILLCNDSMLIINKLDNVFEWINNQTAEYLSLTNSYADEQAINSYNNAMGRIERWYIPITQSKFQESYFLVLSWEAKKLLELPTNRIYSMKEKIVLEYELRWSELAKTNYTTAVMYEIDDYIAKGVCVRKDVYTDEVCRSWWCTLSYEAAPELVRCWLPLMKRHYLNEEAYNKTIEFLVSNQYKCL